MFTEDVHLGVMPAPPHLRIRTELEYKVEINGNPEDTARTVALLESLTQYNRNDLEELLSDAVEKVVQRLAWHGRAVHEIVRDSDQESIYLLHDFTPERLFHLFRYYVQHVPKGDRDLWGKAITVIPEEDIWVVSIPKSLGGYGDYRAVLRQLKKFQGPGPKFWREDLAHLERHSYFELQAYTRESDIYISRVTKRWGWNRRDYGQEKWTEFEQFYRTLTFKWAQAVLREHVIAEFNALLVRLCINSEVSVAGLPNPADILRVRQAMSVGDLSFGEAYDATA